MSDPLSTTVRPISHGDFLLWRKVGQQLRKGLPGGPRGEGGNPKFRHPTQAAAEAEAGRLLKLFPESTFVVLQEVARVKLKAIEPKQPEEGDPAHVFEAHSAWVRATDPDAAGGSAEDQPFAIGGVPQ